MADEPTANRDPSPAPSSSPDTSAEPEEAATSGDGNARGAATVRQIFLSLAVVGICWVFLRFGSLIVSMTISHTWEPKDPVVVAYSLLFRQLVMMFVYPSVLKIFRPAFIPLYNEIKEEEGSEQAMAFARGVLEIGMLVGFLLSAFMWVFPSLTVKLLASGFSLECHAASVRMLRQMAPGILCLLFAEMYLILFHAEKKFGVPHGAEAVQKISWGVGIFVAFKLLGWNNIRAIGLTYAFACFLQLTVNLVGMKRTFGWIYRHYGLGLWGRKWGKRAAVLALPLVVGIAAARLRDLFTIQLQSHLDAVRFNSVEWARQLTNLPLAFMGQIVSIVMLPHLASILHSDGKEHHRQTLETTIEAMWLISIPVVAVTIVMAPELVALVFLPANWTEAHHAACQQGALAMRVIALGFTFMTLENILLPGLFSIKSMWWPIIWGLVASLFSILCLTVLASLGLSETSSWLVAGVAFVYPASRIFKNGILLLVLRKKTGLFPGKRFAVFILKMAGLVLGTLALAYAARLVSGQVLGSIPAGDPALVYETKRAFLKATAIYKARVALQLGVPTAVCLVGFGVLVLLAGYKEHVRQLIQALLAGRGKSKKPTATDGK
ncbi:MAG: oligosaccharide flippase family protein [Lentisphaerae bacterium]|jgi:putative peptidoglycan lipid II flippase|nr:oligosaccharide flippase family protein [Lentisphaerota bacterium]MBT4817293.1 oligosaccharide flippase family protein [Lentisphaerota bacterium]MBT5607726.1 oligosaccharide flippase family protein [Lentisphaerota bacterium]MBT7054889.1 oligosaccharide flippase family protein [Lentisphaerota bacterium]MBT7843341.1 oligosaccharide flippase family protein [Lentisphaerota bacterium]